MNGRRWFLAGVLSLAALGAATTVFAQAAPLTVFAASSLKNVMDDVGGAFTSATGAQVRFVYGASSAMARQVEQGAPADIYISADSQWMDYLAAKRVIDPASRRDLLTNRLVLIAPAASRLRLRIAPGMLLARALADGRLAVAGPDVPAGIYAQAALTRLGVWESVRTRLAPAENVRAAMALVARGETPAGIVYDTDARLEPRVRILGVFPEGVHPKIIYPAARIAASTAPNATPFLTFLGGPRARAIFERYGFKVLYSAR